MSSLALFCTSIAGGTLTMAAADPAEALNGSVFIKSQDAVGAVPVVDIKASVPFAVDPIRIDGDLKDWAKIKPTVVLDDAKYATWSGNYGGKNDLSATVKLCRDDRFLYVAVEMTDDAPPPPSRVEIAFAPANSPLITTWRDVGMRYGDNDLHTAFDIGNVNATKIHWNMIQRGMRSDVVNNAFGTEEERRALLEEQNDQLVRPKIFSKTSRRDDGGKSVTSFEAAYPWKLLAPYDPLSYAPLKFNVAVHDRDNGKSGMLAWTPGIVGTWSAAHFPTLEFDKPTEKTVGIFAQVPKYHYVNQNIDLVVSAFNSTDAPQTGTIEVTAKGADTVLASVPVTLAPGYTATKVPVHSEKIGQKEATLVARLKLADGKTIETQVHAPTLDDSFTIMPVAEVQSKITQLEQNSAELDKLYEQIVSKGGIDTGYPLMYKTLLKMFIARCNGDLKGGDSDRVLRNCAYLEKVYGDFKGYMETVLKDPSKQLKLPPRFDPEALKIGKGYYELDGKPQFLWGPCLFWWMKGDQKYTWELGFNSTCPEVAVPDEKTLPQVKEYLDAFRKNGVSVNVSLANGQFDALKKEHPEVANMDGNNFLPVLIQHPIVREEIAKRLQKDIAFWKDIPGIRSYWLWNEPAYSNFSEMTRQDFIKYLKDQYKTVEALNAKWKSSLASFDDVKIGKELDRSSSVPAYDFGQFQGDQLADFFSFLNKTSKSLDPNKPTHTKFMSISLGALDIERLQGFYDIAGHDGNASDRDIIFLDFCRSVYPDHPIVDTEIHIAYRDKTMVELVAWRLALHGLADGDWWCWHANARFSDTVGNAQSMHGLSVSGLDIQRLFNPYMLALNNKPRTVATLFPKNTGGLETLRYAWGPAQYTNGIAPFYATENMVQKGQLAQHKLLLAGQSGFVKDATYKAVLDWVKAGGNIVLTAGGFAQNEYGDPRDASELVKAEGTPFGDRAKMYSVGKGKVICVTDPAAAKPGEPAPPTLATVYSQVVAKALAELGLEDPVRIAPTDPTETFSELDWRSTVVDGGYVLCALPSNWYSPEKTWNAKLVTNKPVKRIVNLITQTEIAPADFKLVTGPNMFRVELAQ